MTTILKKLIKFEKDLKKYLNRRAHGEIIRKENEYDQNIKNDVTKEERKLITMKKTIIIVSI